MHASLRRNAHAIAALVALLSLVVGTPLLLALTVGNPLSEWDTLRAGDLSDAVVIDLLAALAYLAWAQCAVAVVTEVVVTVGRVPVPRHLPGILPTQQRLAHSLVAAALLAGPTTGHATSSSPSPTWLDRPAAPAITAPMHGGLAASGDAFSASSTRASARQVAPPSADDDGVTITRAMSQGANDMHDRHDAEAGDAGQRSGHRQVTIGDDDVPGTYWDLAERYLGDGQRWRDIWDLNHGRHQPDGATMTTPGLLRPGWNVIIPAGRSAETGTGKENNSAGRERHSHGQLVEPVVVEPGDTLSGIATDHHVDDGWPRLWKINRGRPQPHGTSFTDPDHIEPGWRLDVPVDAPVDVPVERPTDDPSRGADTPSTNNSSTRDHSSITGEPGVTDAPDPDDDSGHRTGGRAGDQAGDEAGEGRHEGTGVELGDGWVGLPLAAGLVAAAAMVWRRRRRGYVPGQLTSAELLDRDLQPMPAVVLTARRAVSEHARHLLQPPDPDLTVAEYAASGYQHHPPPPGPSGLDLAGLAHLVTDAGLGLAGPGAHAAARAFLVATLSSGSIEDPEAQGRIVIPADTLTTLLGAHAVDIGGIPRLTVTSNLAEALTIVEETIIERRRILHDHDAADIAQLRHDHAYHPLIPPVLLLTDTPPASHLARLATTLRLGAPMQISAILLGPWSRGDTLTLDTHGRPLDDPPSPAAGLVEDPTRDPKNDPHGDLDGDLEGGPIDRPDREGPRNPQDGGAARVAVLDVSSTLQMLQMLREAHTGHADAPTPAATSTGHPGGGPVPRSETAEADPRADTSDAAASPSTAVDPDEAARADWASRPHHPGLETTGEGVRHAGSPRVRIRLLGKPGVLDEGGEPVSGLRLHATEMLVYLAVHRGGADRPDLMEVLWPTATVKRAEERLSTEVANLRRTIRRAADNTDLQPVVNTGGHYHLNADLLDVDVWTVADALHQAAAADTSSRAGLDARVAALRRAVTAHTGTLAEGCDYDWIEPARAHYRRQGIRARVHLAEHLIHRHDDSPGGGRVLQSAGSEDGGVGDGVRDSADPGLADDHGDGDLEGGSAGDDGGDLQEAAALLAAAVDLDPSNEDVARRHMQALARLGDAAGVRAQLDRLRAALDELDEEPAPETVDLAARLRRDLNGDHRDR